MTSSQRNTKYNKKWQTVEDDILDSLPYIYKYEDDNDYPCIPVELVNWCENNCQGKWSWWFDNANGYIGFKLQEDLVFFKLSCL